MRMTDIVVTAREGSITGWLSAVYNATVLITNTSQIDHVHVAFSTQTPAGVSPQRLEHWLTI
jgi:hypothetical protein